MSNRLKPNRTGGHSAHVVDAVDETGVKLGVFALRSAERVSYLIETLRVLSAKPDRRGD